MTGGRGKSLMSQVAGKCKSLMKALGRKLNNPDDPDRIGDRGVLASDRRRKATAREEAKRAREQATAVGVGPSVPMGDDLQVGHVRTQLQYASDDDEEMVANDDGDDDEEMMANDDGNDDHDRGEPARKGGRGINFPILDGPPYLEGPCEGEQENLEFMRWFKSHIAIYVWDRHELHATGRVESRNRALETYLGPQDDLMISRLEATGLYHLRHRWLPNMNQQLMLAFVERWQPETNIFHMSWGEMTITLHDVAFIMGLLVDRPLVAEVSQSLECSQSLASLFGLGVMTTTDMFRNKGINWTKVQGLLSKPSATDEKKMQGYLMFLLGSVLFVDKTSSMMKPWWIHYTNDIGVGQYSWAAACLANIYRQLGIATHAGMNEICVGYLSISLAFSQRFPRHIQSSSLGAESRPLAVVVGKNCSIIGSCSTKCHKEI